MPSPFECLVWAILGQQITLAFAYKMKRALVERYGESLDHAGRTYWLFPEAARLAEADPGRPARDPVQPPEERLRPRLAGLVAEDRIAWDEIAARPTEEAITALTALRGVGRWTAEYVLMRGLGHPDVIPAADVGLQSAIGRAYGLERKATEAEVRALAERWAPHRSYAAFAWWWSLAGARPPARAVTLAILADDLTGACDSAVPFARRGLATRVLLALPPSRSRSRAQSERDDVVAVDADTRRLSRRLAVARTTVAARALRTAETTRLFKKVDSTLRGHVGPELLACMRAWDAPLALLCPAFPAMGRWVQGGQIVRGRPWIARRRGGASRAAGRPPDRATGPRDAAGRSRGRRGGAGRAAGGRCARRCRRRRHAGHLTTLVAAALGQGRSTLLAGSGGLGTALADWAATSGAVVGGVGRRLARGRQRRRPMPTTCPGWSSSGARPRSAITRSSS